MANTFVSNNWQDYQIIDAGDGEKLERWGPITVIRPDPQIIWPKLLNKSIWQDCHMHYHRSPSGGGSWQKIKNTPAQWPVSYKELTFNIRPTDFKHMGLFPEQAANWDWAVGLIKGAGRQIKALNLFGYTGAATCCCLNAGACVTHIDAAKGMNQWAKDNISNINITKVEEQICRVMTDDVFKFVQREQRRCSYYDVIMMDPPSYGRGPNRELWKLESRLYELLGHCVALLSDKPLFMLLNTYTTGFTATAAENVLKVALNNSGKFNDKFNDNTKYKITSGPLGLPIGDSGLVLPCGTTVRCKFL